MTVKQAHDAFIKILNKKMKKNTESLVDKMRPHQILFNRRQAGEKLTEEENAILDAGFPVQKAHDALIKALDEHDAKTYFTPSIEDIRIGLICEVKPINESYDWKPAVLHYNSGYEDKGHPNSLYNLKPFWWTYREGEGKFPFPTMIQLQSLNHIRIPYLTKEQIEAEGWVVKDNNYVSSFFIEKDNYMGIIDTKGKFPILSLLAKDVTKIEWLSAPEMFRITLPCKDINTFRYICKLLNIK